MMQMQNGKEKKWPELVLAELARSYQFWGTISILYILTGVFVGHDIELTALLHVRRTMKLARHKMCLNLPSIIRLS